VGMLAFSLSRNVLSLMRHTLAFRSPISSRRQYSRYPAVVSAQGRSVTFQASGPAASRRNEYRGRTVAPCFSMDLSIISVSRSPPSGVRRELLVSA